MERMTRARSRILMLLFGAIACFFGFMLYRMQVVEAGGNTNNMTVYTTYTRVRAARGEILDKSGNVLVSNRASYDLVINHYVLTSASDPNEILYRLVKLCRELGIEYTENLPISKERPFTYTLSDYSAAQQGYFQKFLAYRKNLDSDITAPLLIEKLRESYKIPAHWSDADARAVLGLRYELSLRNCVTSLSNYVFLEDVSDSTLAAILELNIPGMNVETSTVRQYNTKYAAHILGYIGSMNADQWAHYKEVEGYEMDALVGQSGLEEAFESYLHGTDGVRVDETTKDGTLVRSYYQKEPKAGSNVEVSIDLKLQMAAEDALAETVENLRANGIANGNSSGWDAAGAAVVAMDIRTGQVLVCGSYPTFDLSTLFENYNEILNADLQPMFNRALQGEYPPGSTYKMSMVVAGIEHGAIDRYSTITDEGVFTKYAGFTANCLQWTSNGTTHGTINCMDALKCSCNYFFYEVGDRLKLSQIDSTAKGLGLGEHTGIELYERIGHRANAETKAALYTGDHARWYQGDQILASIGQSENRFTPMQMCSYITTLVNKGTRYSATFLNRVVQSDYRGLVYENTVQVLSEMEMSDEAYEAVTTGMWKVANESGGTARRIFQNYRVPVAAKTGTAQTGIRDHSDNGAFACYAPANDPQIAVFVYGERAGSGSAMGGVAKAILDAYFGFTDGDEIITNENQVG